MFWSLLLWFFCFVIWLWLRIVVFPDVFRSHDPSGWGKALWTIFVTVLPYLGVFVYLIARGGKVQHSAQQARAPDATTRACIQIVAGTTTSPADEINRLAELLAHNLISEPNFQTGNAEALAAGSPGAISPRHSAHRPARTVIDVGCLTPFDQYESDRARRVTR